MNEVWKFPLDVTDEQIVEMPAGARILSVQTQGEQLCLWALVNPEADKVDRRILIIGTGNPAPRSLGPFVGTVQQQHGNESLAWHVFDGGTLSLGAADPSPGVSQSN